MALHQDFLCRWPSISLGWKIEVFPVLIYKNNIPLFNIPQYSNIPHSQLNALLEYLNLLSIIILEVKV